MSVASMSDDNDWDDLLLAAQTTISTARVIVSTIYNDNHVHKQEEMSPQSTEKVSRNRRRIFDHERASKCIKLDYLSPDPLFDGGNFEMMFRVSRSRVQRIFEDFASHPDLPFFNKNSVGILGYTTVSLEARVLLPLKCLAYGVATHCFTDYFCMSTSMASQCQFQFDDAFKKVYVKEYLRVPSPQDIKNILELHRHVHNIDGMIGSLDCTHTVWKNCPKAWQGSFKGKGKQPPSMILEATCDYHLWFWHAAYGLPGSLNDTNVLNASPLLEMFVNGKMENLENMAAVVPFQINGEKFDKTFVLVDGIYPRYSRFVKGIKEPLTNQEVRYTAWQEGARKDIERAFGVLKGKFQFVARPILMMNRLQIAKRIATCMMLHNMAVSDRVMDDCYLRYNPMESTIRSDDYDSISYPSDMISNLETANYLINSIQYQDTNNIMENMDRVKELESINDHRRLYTAILSLH